VELCTDKNHAPAIKITCKACELPMSNAYANRDALIKHALRCDEFFGDGTCPKILPCCNKSSFEIMRQGKYTHLCFLSKHIKYCVDTRKPPGRRSKTEHNTENENPN
jgi:hypothetical protein